LVGFKCAGVYIHDYALLLYTTAVYTLVNSAITVHIERADIK